MFQDEARFGRMARPKRGWATAGCRPVMANGYEREFTYVYGAVSPVEGEMEWMLCREMNTERMTQFLAQVSARYRDFVHREGARRGQLAQSQSADPAREHRVDPTARLCARTQSPGASLG